MSDFIKTPIGVSPHWFVNRERIAELASAITRYIDFIKKNDAVIDTSPYYNVIANWAKEIEMVAVLENDMIKTYKYIIAEAKEEND